ELTLTVMVDADLEAGAQISNVAIVSSTDDPDTPKESDPEVVVVNEPTDSATSISVTKTSDVDNAKVGDMVDFMIHIENSGDNVAYGISVVDSIPQGTMAIQSTPTAEMTESIVHWKIDSLGVGESV